MSRESPKRAGELLAPASSADAPLADQELLRLFVEHTPAAVAMVDRDMRYLMVSRRWLSNYRLPLVDVRGRSHYDLVPEIPERWRQIHQRCLAGAVESAEADAFPRTDGSIDWVRWEIHPWRRSDGDIGGLVLFSEVITDRVKGDLERTRVDEQLREESRINETLNRIGASLSSELDLDRLVQRLTDEATALCGAQFGALFYNVTDQRGGSYMLYTISGVPREAFSKFPQPRNTAVFAPTFAGQGVVRSDDITQDPRYGHNAPHQGMPKGHLPVCSYLAVPVISRSGTVIGGLFFGHSERAVFTQRDERLMVAVAAQASVAMDNARLFAEANAARAQAEMTQNRFAFLADASEALAGSLDYEVTLRRVAELAVPRIADWCTVAALDEQNQFRRVAVVHRDPAKQPLIAAYQMKFPPGDHRSSQLLDVLAAGTSVLRPSVSQADMAASAQDDEHLRIMIGLGCASCMMVPVMARGQVLGVVSLMRGDGAPCYDADDLAVAEELAHRAALAIDNARLYRETTRREETTAFLAEASAILASSLDYQTTLQSLADVVVPRFGDWCAVEVLEGDKIVQVAVAHVDAAKVEFAQEAQRRWPPDPNAATGTPNVLRTGRSELYPDIPDELLVAGARDPDHLRVSRALGMRSALVVPLAARGRTLGALTLVWAESGRRYTAADVTLMEELGRRAGIAVDNARLYDEAQNAIRLRDEFLSIASHELKTPLTSLQLQVSGMQRRFERGKPEQLTPERLGANVQSIDRQLVRLGTLVNALLDVSRASAGGGLPLELADVDLGELAHEVVARLQADLQSARCEVALRLTDGVVGRWDRLRLDQVITNFVSNAIKYGAGQPIEVGVSRDGAHAVISVRDRGIGIEAKDQQRIFERFARAVSSAHFGGLGLGLWIVRVFVEAMDGSVDVQSAPGDGATFRARLPIRAEAA